MKDELSKNINWRCIYVLSYSTVALSTLAPRTSTSVTVDATTFTSYW